MIGTKFAIGLIAGAPSGAPAAGAVVPSAYALKDTKDSNNQRESWRCLRIQFRIESFDPIVKPILQNCLAHLPRQPHVISQIVNRVESRREHFTANKEVAEILARILGTGLARALRIQRP